MKNNEQIKSKRIANQLKRIIVGMAFAAFLFGSPAFSAASGTQTESRGTSSANALVKLSHLTGTVLMVSPDDFAFNPETAGSNAFQHKLKDTKSVTEQAMDQFDSMVSKLEENGIHVIRLPSRKDIRTPDAVFPNNWFSTHQAADGGTILVIYPMLTPNRRAEIRVDLVTEFLKKNGFEVNAVVDLSNFTTKDIYLEGTGSMVLDRVNKVAFGSLSPRTDLKVLNTFCSLLGYRPVAFHTYDQKGKLIYHTNVIMSVGDDFAVIAADNIKDEKEKAFVLQELKKLGKKIILISPEQVDNMCGNILELKSEDGENVIVMSNTAFDHFTDEQKTELGKSGRILPMDIHTIEKVGGGSARCMLGEVF